MALGRWRPSRRWLAVAALVLVAVYVIGPQPHVEWVDAVTAVPATYQSCAPGTDPTTAPAPSNPYLPGAIGVGTPVCMNGAQVIPRVRETAAVPGQSERHRVALYLVGVQWRLFDVNLSTNRWLGFATGATYR